MIKNIVFDMGKVLTDYSAKKVCSLHTDSEEDAKLVETAVFVSPEWVLLDMGLISEEKALENMKSRVPKRLHESMSLCMRDWHLYNLWKKEDVGELVKELKEKGFKLYICSNAALRLEIYYKECIPNWDLFDGILFSAQVKLIKPQKQMYECLYEKFKIKPEESFFIDDLDINIEGAAATGMKGYIFDGDVAKLKRRLEEVIKG